MVLTWDEDGRTEDTLEIATQKIGVKATKSQMDRPNLKECRYERRNLGETKKKKRKRKDTNGCGFFSKSRPISLETT